MGSGGEGPGAAREGGAGGHGHSRPPSGQPRPTRGPSRKLFQEGRRAPGQGRGGLIWEQGRVCACLAVLQGWLPTSVWDGGEGFCHPAPAPGTPPVSRGPLPVGPAGPTRTCRGQRSA